MLPSLKFSSSARERSAILPPAISASHEATTPNPSASASASGSAREAQHAALPQQQQQPTP